MLKKWSNKWDVFNKLKQINYSSSKNISSLGIMIVKILKKIKKLDINIEEIIAIKLINGLDSLFETYFIMLSQKARNKN